jgi:hypothetical protein
MYRDPPRPPPVGVTVGVNGGDALKATLFFKSSLSRRTIGVHCSTLGKCILWERVFYGNVSFMMFSRN